MSSQSKLESASEVFINTGIGFLISLVIWETLVAFHLFGLDMNHGQNLVIVGIFTVAALGRSYIVRRYFNAELHKLAINMAKSILSFWK